MYACTYVQDMVDCHKPQKLRSHTLQLCAMKSQRVKARESSLGRVVNGGLKFELLHEVDRLYLYTYIYIYIHIYLWFQ